MATALPKNFPLVYPVLVLRRQRPAARKANKALPMTATREVHADGWCVCLDMSRQVLRLEVPEADDWHHERRRSADPPLRPVLPLDGDGPVPAATLLLKAKQFDDGLYAAVELAAQQGAGRFTDKTTLLRSLAATLAAGLPIGEAAAAAIQTACELGGVPVAVAEPRRRRRWSGRRR
jgi:hypothetical protein